MKTADLIPFILIELNERDKYGFELTKDIETKSEGKIVIKQPTLYTVLKKLEKSKFISSYWEDSEIGGKRHYYKITNNGRLQLSTLPNYDVLLSNLEKEENPEAEENSTNNPTPLEAIMPSSEVFAESNIDNSTEMTINQANAELISEVKTDEFADNTSVMEFTKSIPTPAEEIKNIVSVDPKQELKPLIDLNYEIDYKTEVKFQEYQNIKKSEAYLMSKKANKFITFKTITFYLILLGVSLITYAVTKKTGTSPIFFAYFYFALTSCLFYPIIIALNSEHLVKKYKTKKYNYLTSILFSTLALALTIIFALFVNISLNNSSLTEIFALSNFENFYAPILITSCLYSDAVFAKLYFKKPKQNKEN